HRRRLLGKAQIDDLDDVAALLVEADGGADQGGDAVELLLGARLVDRLALVVLAVDAVDQDADRDALHPAALDDFGALGPRNLVVDDLFRLLALLARRRVFLLLLAGARELVVGPDPGFRPV